jgi:hypothetical protein
VFVFLVDFGRNISVFVFRSIRIFLGMGTHIHIAVPVFVQQSVAMSVGIVDLIFKIGKSGNCNGSRQLSSYRPM